MKKILKEYPILFRISFKCWCVLLNMFIYFLRFFIRQKENVIIFNSFYGRQYSDSPMYLYEKIISDERFENFDCYWIFNEPKNFENIDKKVKKNTLAHLIMLLKAKYWITNSDIDRFFSVTVKKNKSLYINTWHGIPIKHLGSDEKNIDYRSKEWFESVNFDLLCACGDYDKACFEKIFSSTSNKVKITGLPRNECLKKELGKKERSRIIDSIGIPKNKKIILYAPTFRDYESLGNNTFKIENKLFESLSDKQLEELKKKYVVLIRGHYLNTSINCNNDFLFNVSTYEKLNELILISDILITDYSSMLFDYSVTEKPILLYLYDYEKYIAHRELYFDISLLGLPIAKNDNQLFECLMKNGYTNTKSLKNKFQKNTVDNSTELIIRWMIDKW